MNKICDNLFSSAAARVNDSTAKASQTEIVFPVRPESNIHNERERNGPNSISIERKGTLAIGTYSFTDSPPGNEYGLMGNGNKSMLYVFNPHK